MAAVRDIACIGPKATSHRDMLRIEETVLIGRPALQVWNYVTNPENDTVWMSNLLEYQADWDEQPQVGDGTRRVARIAGRRCEFTAEITEVVPGEALGWKSVDAPFPFHNGLRLEKTEDGTRLTFHGRTPGMRGFFGKLADPIVARMFGRDMASNLQRLKEILEDDDPD